VAAEILLEGRMWNAEEAFAKGLLTRVVPDVEVEAEAYAADAGRDRRQFRLFRYRGLSRRIRCVHQQKETEVHGPLKPVNRQDAKAAKENQFDKIYQNISSVPTFSRETVIG
jgi:enoyl-CoA hydratase/carnithine racemase